MSNFNFSQPTRQSSKGIIVIFGLQLVKFFKNSFILFIPFIIRFINKGNVYGLHLLYVLLIFFGILALILLVSILKYLNFKFYSSSEGFHLEKGIINKENILIPKAKIQNVYIKQNLLQQVINVSSLTIETAGNDNAEVEISALPLDFALELKKELMANRTSEILVDDTIVYYKASIGKLFLEGITNNHIKSTIIILTFFIGWYYENKEFLQEYKLNEKLNHWFPTESDSLYTIILINLVAIVVMLIGVMLFSILKTILVNYNLTVTEQNKNLEISKGLFNKVNLNLLPSRIQSITITTNRLKQLFHLNTLHIKQAMTNKEQKDKLSVVGLNDHQVDYLIDHMYSGFTKPGQKQKPELYFKRLLIIRSLILLLILNTMIYVLNDSSFWFINLLVVPYAFLFVKYTYRKACYSVEKNYVTIESGFIESTLHILEVHKIQSVSFTQTIFQKRNQIASVKIDTASNSVQIQHIKDNHAKYLSDFLLYNLEISQKSWM